jgi:RimJ/RimL family protein N-acetyltransferase
LSPDSFALGCVEAVTARNGGEFSVGVNGLHARRLGVDDLPAYEQHLLRLARLDRYNRFQYSISDAGISGYVGRTDPARAILFGAFDSNGRIVGVAEARPSAARKTVEVGVAIDQSHRRRGLGRSLVANVVALAFAGGAQSAEFSYAPINAALIHLVSGLGAQFGPTHGYAWIARPRDTHRE